MKHKKIRLWLLLIILFPLENFAQRRSNEVRSNNYLKFDFSIGENIDIPPSSDHENADLLGSRPASVPFFAFKATHLFSEKLGWYAGLRMDFYKGKESEIYGQDGAERFFEDMFDGILGPLSQIKPTLDAGLVYRIERERWSLLPSIGLGYSCYGVNRNSSKTRINDLDQSVKLTYIQEVSFLIGNVGLSANYYIGRKSFFLLNAGFQHPLQSSYALLSQEIDGVEKVRTEYRTSDAGRNIYVGFGYGFILGGKKRNF